MKINDILNKTPTLACDISAIPKEKRNRWIEVGKEVYSFVTAAEELENGYSFQLPNRPGMILLIAEYVSYDSLCCSFIHWNIEIKPENGPIWLFITGGPGAKELTRATLETTSLLMEEIATSLGFDLSKRRSWTDVMKEEKLLK